MRYEKPVIIDLNGGARAAGGDPLACINGTGATSGGETCGNGPSAAYTCALGTAGPYGELCIGGSNPGGGSEDCFGGSGAYFCGSGSSGDPDPHGCRTDPCLKAAPFLQIFPHRLACPLS